MKLRSEDGSTVLSLTAIDATLPPLPMSSVKLELEVASRLLTARRVGWFELDTVAAFADDLELALTEDVTSSLVAFSHREVQVELIRRGARIPTLRVELAAHVRPVADAPMDVGVVWIETWDLRGLAEHLRTISREDHLAELAALGWPEDDPEG